MQQNFQSCKKGGQVYVPVTLEFLFLQRKHGIISNTAFVLMALQVLQPFKRVHVIRPYEFRRQIGAPWPDGVMPERSFNQAIQTACKKGLIAVTKDDDGSWLVVTDHDVFSCCDPAKVCRGSGKGLPEESLKPAHSMASSSPKKEHDRIFKNKGLKEQQEQQSEVVVFSNKFDQEKSTDQRSVEPSQEGSNKSDTAKDVDRDKISAALAAASCNDENFVRTYVEQAPDGELAALERMLDRASEADIRDALAAMKEQHHRLRRPIRWLIKAIKERFKPNVSESALENCDDVQQWRKLSAVKGVITYSVVDRDAKGGGFVEHNFRQIPLETAMELWPYEWLITLPDCAKSLLSDAFNKFGRRYFDDVDENLGQLGMYRSQRGYLLPILSTET